ncbi:MAG: uroporphyrinogen-III C-methyltransferase [Candidatus Nitricoxidivorans perseverans]|uniref:Uroporphyrinogen-III C-methyltransferase n=1 Tax=Candidatus Nitricoxidivorans perseverans TaxID=2975601 RepID=A0AA49J0A0_9PROT|nr:MAG: uroporphyrinogen-III C-methyltransferase [Candidatus Nitricoxidivorans perseverans]
MSTPPPDPSETPAPAAPRQAWLKPLPVAAIVATAALLLLGWQWLETRGRLANVQEELTRRLADSDAVARESRALARQNQEAVLALQAKVGLLEARLAEAQGQQLALEAMYQELSRSRDERLLAEIEQAVAIAAQQLQLAGNVRAALIALEGADARLARAGQARFLSLRKLIGRDIERLKALPTADVPGIALKLETVLAAIDTLPFAYEQRPKASPARAVLAAKPSQSPLDASFWQSLAADLWAEMKPLVRIERTDAAGHADPALLSPSQSFFLRENIKLRLVNARLALLSRDGRSFREDVRQASGWLERHFDTRAKAVQAASATLKGLATVDVAIEPPALNETLGALRNTKVAQEKK